METLFQHSNLLNILIYARRRLMVGWAVALIMAWLLSLVVVTPVAAQSEITDSAPCFSSTNLTNLSGGGNRGITNQPVISGNGTRVAFWSVNNLGGGNPDGNIEVFVRETSSTSVAQLTDSVGSILGGFNLEPSINTAGTHIAFYSDRDLVVGQNADGNFEIFLARRAGNGAWGITQVTDTQGSANLFPSINSAGDRIAFVSDDSELHSVDQSLVNSDRNFEIFLATIPSSGGVQFRQITNTGAGVTNDQPVINAAGSRIAFTAASGQTAQVFVWDESQGAPAQLTQSDINDQPSISADGTSIVYIATNTDDRSRVVLHTLSADGSESRAEVIVPAATNTKYRSPSISGNGGRVVYVSEQGTGSAIQINVLLYDVSTGLGVPISEVGGGTGEQPAISSDGTRVTFVGVQALAGSTDNAGSDIYLNECPQADLVLEFRTSPPATVLAGNDVIFQLRVTNRGPSLAKNAFFRSDLGALPDLPNNVDYLLPAGCTIDAEELLVCTLGDIPVNGTVDFTFGYDIPSNAGLGNIVSEIEVRADVVDPNRANNTTGRFTTRVFEESALSLQVTTDPDTILAGSPEQLTYDLIVTNAGPSQARSARITNTLPVGAGLVSFGVVQGGGQNPTCPTPVGNVVVCNLGNLTAGSNTIVRIVVTSTAAAPETFTNVATVRSLTQESNLANNTVVTQTPVERAADMAITKIASPADFVIAGREITYTLFFTNNGFADTVNPTVIDTLPQNVTYVRSVLPGGATCSASGGGQIVTCAFTGNLLVGASRSFSIVALVDSIVPAGFITNTARIFSGRADPVAGNDTTPPVPTEVRVLADLVVAKSVNTTTPDIREIFTYTVKLRNAGPSQAYDVVVTDILPSELSFVDATATVGNYDANSGLWTVGTLPVRAVGQEETLAIRVQAIDSAGGKTKRNTATAVGSQPEPTPGLPSSAFVDVIPQRANVQVTKTSVPNIATKVIAGQRLTYTLSVVNSGPTLARSVLLTDVLPANVFLVSVTEPGGRANCLDGTTITCNVGDMANGATLNYTVVMTRALKGMITNTVSASSLTPDIVPGNNSAVHTIMVDAGLPDNLVFTQQPPDLETAGEIFDPVPRVQIRDRFNNLIDATAGQSDQIRLIAYTNATCTTPVATPSDLNNAVVVASGGEANFPALFYTNAETIYLLATNQTRSGVDTACSEQVIINPDSTKQLRITTPEQTVIAGRRSAPIVVQREDQFGNPTFEDNFTVTLTTSSLTGSFLNGVDTQISTVLITDTFASASFYYTDTLVGTYDITVGGGSVIPFTQQIEIVAGPASALLLVVAAPTEVIAGEISGDITVARIDDFGNENTDDETLVVELTSNSPNPSEYDFYDDDGTTIIMQTSIFEGSSRATFSYRDIRAGVRQLNFNDEGGLLAGESITLTVVPAATNRLVFVTPPKTVTAGQLSTPIEIAREDEFGNRNFEDANLSVTLESTSSGAPDFTPDSPLISEGSDDTTFQYSDTLAGVFNLTISSGALVDASQPITVIAAAANKLVVLTNPQTIVAGQPSSAITIQRRDTFGNPAPNGGNLVVNLTSPSTTGRFVPTNSLTSIPSVTIAGTNASFRYTDTVQGIYQLTFNGGGTFLATQTITVTPSVATKLVFTAKPDTAIAGINSDLFVVERQDQFNNPSPGGTDLTVNLDTSSLGAPSGGEPIFISGSGTPDVDSVTIPAGIPTTTFRYNDTRAATALITASGGGLTAATGTILILPAPANKISFFLPSAPVVAGEPSDLITVQVEDQYSNPVTPTAGSSVILDLTTTADQPVDTPAGFRASDDELQVITSVTIFGSPTGSFRYYDEKIGTPSMIATSVGPTFLAASPFNQPITVVAADPVTVRAESAANGSGTPFDSQNVTAGQTRTLHAIARDAFGNFVSNPTANWEIAVTGGVTTNDINPTTGASTVFTARKVGTAVITPEVTGLASVATGTFTVIPGAATKIRVEDNAAGGATIPPQTLTPGDTLQVFAVTRDQFDNFVANPAGATWAVISDTGGIESSDLVPSVNATTGANATFTANKVGVGGIQATFGSLSIVVPTGLLTVVAGPPTQVRAESAADGSGTPFNSQNVTAGQTRTLYAIARDAVGNFVSNPTAIWEIAVTGGVATNDLNPTTGASTVFTARKVGTAVITPEVTDLASVATGTFTVIPGTATKIRVEDSAAGGATIPAQTLTAGDTLQVFAITRDSFDNFVANPAGATWSVISDTGGIESSDLVPSVNATTGANATFTANKVGVGGIQATFGGLSIVVPTGLLTVQAGPATQVRAETAANGSGAPFNSQNVTAGATVTLHAIARDVAGNFVSNPTANWEIANTGGVATNDINPTSGTSTVFTARKAGTAVITPEVTDLASVATGTFTVIAGTATKIRVEDNAAGGATIPTQSLTAGDTLQVFAITRDQFDNFVANPAGATWSVISDTGGIESSDLVPSVNATTGANATFTANKVGVGGIQATFGGLSIVVPTGLLTVQAGDADYLDITNSTGGTTGSANAGVFQQLRITAYDVAGNVATSYNGTKALEFSGAQASLNPVQQPQVRDQSGAVRDFGQETDLLFVNGVMTTTNSAGTMRIYRAGTNIQINVEDADDASVDSLPDGTFTTVINALTTVHRFALSTPTTSLTAGVPVNLTITAQDQFGNTVPGTTYNGAKTNIRFSSTPSATAPNGAQATVIGGPGPGSNAPATVNFGSDTRIIFTNGVATTSAAANGVMTIYKSGTFTINVAESDNSPTSSPASDPGVGYLVVNVGNSPNQNMQISFTSPQTNGVAVAGTNAITLTDAFQNPVAINAATRPVVLTTSLNGSISLTGSGNDNTLNETNDFVSSGATGQANLTGLGLTYTGVAGTGRITATVASPAGGFISKGANVTIIAGAPSTLRILGRVGAAPAAANVEVSVGTPISMVIDAFDVSGNTASNFNGDLSLTFAAVGSPTAAGHVTNSSNAAIMLGSATVINFVGGVATVQANGSNGRLVLNTAGIYAVTAAGTGITTPGSNALNVDVVAIGGTGSADPEDETPEAEPSEPVTPVPETPEQEKVNTYLPSTGSGKTDAPEGIAPEQNGAGTLYLPNIPN